ncbi:MAG: hypothetical protein DRH04_03460 [Deltaproteobacteria bacterium]|nr:MAG: hypothetical protein DRH04_03460 [Deltaproteobacteria bacterium]
MKWKRNFNAADYRLAILLTVLLVVCGCAGRQLVPRSAEYVRPDRLASIWGQLAEMESLYAGGVIKLEARDGQKNSQRIRIAARAPDRLKMQWLTPWHTVVWQLLIDNRQFWLSDSHSQITYHGWLGLKTGKNSCKQQSAWWTYIELMASWRLLFSKPSPELMSADSREEPGLANLPTAETEYLVTADRTMPAGKIIRFADGSQWRINYLEFVTVKDGRIFPRKLEIICPAAKVELRFSTVQLDHDFKEKTFSYQQKNFSLKEVDCHNLLTP